MLYDPRYYHVSKCIPRCCSLSNLEHMLLNQHVDRLDCDHNPEVYNHLGGIRPKYRDQ